MKQAPKGCFNSVNVRKSVIACAVLACFAVTAFPAEAFILTLSGHGQEHCHDQSHSRNNSDTRDCCAVCAIIKNAVDTRELLGAAVAALPPAFDDSPGAPAAIELAFLQAGFSTPVALKTRLNN